MKKSNRCVMICQKFLKIGKRKMKIMVAADIHGSAYYCEKLLKKYKEEACDKLLLLGDILYHGPRNDLPEEYNPKKVLAMLNEMKNEILCVRGNCDTEVDQMVLEFPVLAEYCLLYLDHITIFATHGHKFNKNFMPNLAENEVLLHGHTHVPACEKVGNNMYMNPGSVSIPKENSHHGYMTIEDGRFLWKDLDGNIKNSYPSA